MIEKFYSSNFMSDGSKPVENSKLRPQKKKDTTRYRGGVEQDPEYMQRCSVWKEVYAPLLQQ